MARDIPSKAVREGFSEAVMPEGMRSDGQLSSRRLHLGWRDQQGWGTSIPRLRRQVAHWACEKEQREQGWYRWSLEFYWRETSWQGHEALLAFRFGVTSMHSGLSPQLGPPRSGVDCVCTCGCVCMGVHVCCTCATAHIWRSKGTLSVHLHLPPGWGQGPCLLSAHTTVKP